jgi:hypothetical protein
MADDYQRALIQHAQDDLKSIGPEVAVGPQRSFLDAAKDYFIDRLAPEIGDMLMHKTAQGAAELGQALNSQADAYVPYGAGQAPLSVEGPATDFQQHLRDAAQSVPQDPDRGIER